MGVRNVASGAAMSANDIIDFWFTVGSTYTYLTVSRLQEVEAASGIRFRWRPFNARAIMQEMDNVPFATKPIKLAYMWRDVERRASKYGLPIKVPAPYPLKNFDLASRVAVLGAMEGWCPNYVRASYRRWFVEGKEAGAEPNLSESLSEIGQDPDRIIATANSESIGRAYDDSTREARQLNIFGAPTFVARGELFWGDDRLDDAIAWHTNGTLKPT
jgi:2-hydroxychromene-2-carboxylate isomerase